MHPCGTAIEAVMKPLLSSQKTKKQHNKLLVATAQRQPAAKERRESSQQPANSSCSHQEAATSLQPAAAVMTNNNALSYGTPSACNTTLSHWGERDGSEQMPGLAVNRGLHPVRSLRAGGPLTPCIQKGPRQGPRRKLHWHRNAQAYESQP